MLNQSWFRNQNNVVCCRKEEVLPKLARELAIPDLSQRVEEFQKTPTAEGVNISGRRDVYKRQDYTEAPDSESDVL